MDKLNLHMLENYDFKRIMDKCGGRYLKSDEDQIKELLKEIENNKNKAEANAAEIFCNYKYGNSNVHLDDSNRKNKYVRAIYNVLWGRQEKRCNKECKKCNQYKNCRGVYGENGYSINFRTLFITQKNKSEKALLYGGETANTVKHLLNWENGWNNGEDKEKYNVNKNELCEILRGSGCRELFDCYHYIGNFLLVPAYFNAYRGGNDFFDSGLYKLQKYGWGIIDYLVSCNRSTQKRIVEIEAKNKYRNFFCKDFNAYVNTMFLWDYVKAKGKQEDKEQDKKYTIKSLCKKEFIDEMKGCEYGIHTKDEIEKVEKQRVEMTEKASVEFYVTNAKYAIERRSCFMVAMLRIALDVNWGGVKYKYAYNDAVYDEWEGWKVSPIYKKIMHEVFWENGTYSGYKEVIGKISDVVDKTKMDESAKDNIGKILKELEKKLDVIKEKYLSNQIESNSCLM